MHPIRIVVSCVMVIVAAASIAHADDLCLGQEERAAAMSASAALRTAEQSGKQAAIFSASMNVVANDCMDRYDKNVIGKAKANLPTLGRELAKSAERNGVLYSSEPVRADGQTSAFRYFETIGDHQEANRVLLKAVQSKPDDLRLFETAWDIDTDRRGSSDSGTGSRPPYHSPPGFRQNLTKVASANADRLMKAEERDAQGLTGGINECAQASMQSLEKLKRASLWMKYLPGGEKPAQDRAEQRGDTIMKRADPTFTHGQATAYYEFSGSPRAKEVIAQIKKKVDASQRALEKTGENMKDILTQKSEAEQQQFNKKKADLEKELGF